MRLAYSFIRRRWLALASVMIVVLTLGLPAQAASPSPAATGTKQVQPVPAGAKKTPSLANHPTAAPPNLPKLMIKRTTDGPKRSRGAKLAATAPKPSANAAPVKHNMMLPPPDDALDEPLYMQDGVGPGCLNENTAVNSTFYGPNDSSGSWEGEIDNTCVPNEPCTMTETAGMTDSLNESFPTLNGPTGQPWYMTWGAANIPTTPGTYTYTAHYYRRTDYPPSDTSFASQPDTLCTRYDLANATPYPNSDYPASSSYPNLMYTEECWMDVTTTITGQATPSCNWTYGSVSQDGLDDAEYTNDFTCTNMPSGSSTNGTMRWVDWSNTPLSDYPEYNSTGNTANGFRIDTGWVQFLDGQQIGTKVSDTVILGGGWTWGSSSGCTNFNNNSGTACTWIGNYQTISGSNATATPTATVVPTATPTPGQSGSCAITVVGTLNVGNEQTVLRMAVTPSSGQASGIIQWIPAGGQNTVVFANVVDGEYIYNQDGSYINTGIGSRTFETSGNVNGVSCAMTTSQQFIIT